MVRHLNLQGANINSSDVTQGRTALLIASMIDMRIDTGVDICTDMCGNMCRDMWIGMYRHVYTDVLRGRTALSDRKQLSVLLMAL